MPSGRKGRGSRHRKQKLEELLDYDEDSNLSHGPDPTPSPWTMEPLPPHVEGPPVLKQDAESVESLPRGINRKEASLKALRVQLPPPSKRKKGATPRMASDTDVANSATATSLDRWDGGDLQVDETLPYFYPSRGELEVASYELKNSNDKVEVLANGTGSKDSKSDGNMKMRKWKSRPEVAAGNRSSTVIDAFGPRQQVESSPSNSNMHTKHNATHQKGLSELECNETTPSVDMNAAKGLKLGSSALERVESNFPIGGSSKRVEKENGAAARLSHTFETDAFKDEPEWKRGKANDLGLSSSPKLHISRPKRSEGLQMSQRFGDLVQIVSRDDAEVLEKPQYAAGKGTDWALQEDNRNPELEKELENRIRRRREESREESGEKEKWREYEKEKSIRRHLHQKEERYKEESRHREEKNQEEKTKEDGGRAEKGRIDSRQKDEKYKENRYMESKLKEEKQKTDRNRQLPCRDDKECKENRKVDKDKEQRRIDGRLRGDRHKVEKEKDNIQKEDRDAKQKEDSFRDGRCRVDKDKEQKLKDEKVRHYRNKEQRLRDDQFERHKEENSWNARFQDEKEKQVRPRDKVDRAKDRDKEERLETIKEGKVRDERGKNPIKEDLKDEKGSHGKKKGEGEQEDINRTDKLQDKRQKIDKQQDGRDKDEREKVASRHRDDREGESRQREAISKEEKLQHYKDGDESQGVDHRQRSKGEKVAMDRLVDLREKADREKGDGERPVDVNGSGDKEAKQAEVHGKSREVLDGRKEDDKQDDGWWTKDIGHFDMDRDFCLSQDELGIIQSKDLPDQLRVRKAHEREARGDRKVVEKLTVQEGDRRGTKASKDDTQDRERAFSVVASSDAMVAHKSEHRLKRTRDAGTVDSAITEKSHERSRGKHFEVENDLPLDDYKVLHCNHEDRLSPYDAPPRSPSPSLPDGNLPPSSEKAERRSKFEMSISVSSSSGTQWARERIRHVIEQTDRIKQHHDLEEEVKSWDPRGTNQDSDDGRGWSLSPNKNWDAFSSLPPDSGKKEYQRGLMRGQEDGYASEREHHRFSRSGGPSKTRRVDGGPRERKEWRLQGSQMKRAPMGGAMVRPQVQARLLPPPPPFRPGIDNPAVIGARGSNYDEGPGSRESGRYDRKLGGAFKRSEMGGPGEMWKGVGVSMGIENWNVQNPGLGPGNMFSPFAHIGGHPSAGFLGMAQHFPVPPLYGSGSAPSSDMGFGGGARYHAGDAVVRFPLPHGPYHGPVMGWQRLAEPNENRLPLVDTWEGHGHYIDERHRFGYLEWDQGGKGMTGGDPWQGQAGDASTGLNPPCFQRDASCQGNIPVEASTFYKDNDQKIEDPLQEILDTTDPQTASPADPAHVMMREVPQVESKATVQSKARLTRILLNLDVSAKLASNDLYKQYLSLLPASEVKIREMLVLKQGDAHGPIEEDLEFEVDSEAQELLSTPGLYADLLPQLSNNAFEEAVAIYHRPIQHTSVQKSVFGSFILPVDSSLIKMPSLGADFSTIRVGQLEAFGDQSCSSNGFGGPLSGRKESLIRASRLVADTLQDGTQDNQGSSPMRDEFSMGQGVEINPRSKQEGVAEVSFKQGGYGGTLGDEEMAINVDMVAYQMPSAGVVNCNIGLDIPVAEANVELSAIAEMQAREDGNARQMEVVRLDCKGGEWPTGRDDSILVEHCSEAFKEGWRKQHNEAAKERENGVGSASQSSVSNARPEWQIVLEPGFKIDEVKINSRPQQSSENAYENTH